MLVTLNKIRDTFLIRISISKRDYFGSMFIFTTQIYHRSFHSRGPEVQFWFASPLIHQRFPIFYFPSLDIDQYLKKQVLQTPLFCQIDCLLGLGPVILHCFNNSSMPSTVCFNKIFYQAFVVLSENIDPNYLCHHYWKQNLTYKMLTHKVIFLSKVLIVSLTLSFINVLQQPKYLSIFSISSPTLISC